MPRGTRLAAASPVVLGVILLALAGRTPANESKKTFTFQARVTQNGVPLTADLDLTFEIYTVQTV